MTYQWTQKDIEAMQADHDHDDRFGLAGTDYLKDLDEEAKRNKDKFYNGWAEHKGGII